MGWLEFLKPKQIKESTAPSKTAGRREALGKLKESLDSWQMFDFLRDRYYGNGQWYFPVGGLPAVGGTTNKIQGRNQYVFYTEQDLRFQRDAARILYASEPVAKAIEGNLNAFVVGKGMKYKLCLKKGFETKATEEQLQEYQQLLDAWMDTEQWPEREQECFTAKVVDGEYFLRAVKTKGRVRTIRIEPEHIQNPEGVSFEDGWWLGVKYDPKDYETPVAYGYKLYGQEWEEIPAEEIIHFKSNVSRNVSRGVSDFYPILDDLDSIAKLSDNMQAGATAQAEIAYMMSVENATPNSINTFADEQAEVTLTNPVTGMEDKSRRSKPGTVKYHGDNVKFTTMPQGASQGYIEVYQNSMRIVASAFCMPEYMLTSDASNANYSSTLVAGTPFYRYVEKLQNLLKRPFKQVMMRVLDSLYADAQIPTELRAYLDIDVTCDSPVVVDPYQDAQRRDIELRNGVISPQMWAMEQGRDPQKVQQQIDEWRDANMGAVQQGGMGGQQQGNDGGMSIPKPGADGLGMDGVLAKESAIRESSWEEQKHPRASDGRFGHVSGAHGGKANVVSKADLDTHIKASKGRELYRGVPKKEHAKQFETGELRHGKGAYGHGIYVGYGYNGRDTASNAAGDEGHLARMSLSSDAKTITWNDAEEMWNKEGKEQYSIEKHGSSENAIAQMMRERGYDAIDVEHNEFMNVLNPEALVVENPGGVGEKPEQATPAKIDRSKYGVAKNPDLEDHLDRLAASEDVSYIYDSMIGGWGKYGKEDNDIMKAMAKDRLAMLGYSNPYVVKFKGKKGWEKKVIDDSEMDKWRKTEGLIHTVKGYGREAHGDFDDNTGSFTGGVSVKAKSKGDTLDEGVVVEVRLARGKAEYLVKPHTKASKAKHEKVKGPSQLGSDYNPDR